MRPLPLQVARADLHAEVFHGHFVGRKIAFQAQVGKCVLLVQEFSDGTVHGEIPVVNILFR
jgi:hypothetical protein